MLDNPKPREDHTISFFRSPLSSSAVNPTQLWDDKHKSGLMKHATGEEGGNPSGRPKNESTGKKSPKLHVSTLTETPILKIQTMVIHIKST
jgi:hypothetical protein